jgi:nitric oxide reductase NorD protein
MKTAPIEELKEGLVRNLRLDFFEDDEISEIFGEIESFDHRLRQKILALSLNLSHASSSLVLNTVRKIKKASLILSFKETDEWLATAFELLDSKGIDPFMSFISKTDEEALKKFKKEEGVFLKNIAAVIEAYIKGIAGRDIRVAPDREPFTDTFIIFLPHAINKFSDNEKNFFLYKLIATHQWANIAQETLVCEEDGGISKLFDGFKERELAIDIYNIIEAMRHEYFLNKELPGLMKKAADIKAEIFNKRPDIGALTDKTAVVEGLYQYHLAKKTKGYNRYAEAAIKTASEITGHWSVSMTINYFLNIYDPIKDLSGDYEPRGFYFGTIKPGKVSQAVKAHKKSRKKSIESMLAKLIHMPESGPSGKRHAKGLAPKKADPDKDYLLIKGRLIELDEEIRNVVEEKGIGGVLVKGSETGGESVIKLPDIEEEEETEAAGGGIKYDEWDYRRGDYKKNWCSIYERDIHPGREPFVELTINRYGGYINILRKKFELLKKEPKIVRRQKEGEDIDIDAAVEAFADMRAGISPSERIFARLDREERNIAALFLIDMSGSTKGWVNEAEKESLVLMCEALESLGDRYAVYGFSGMTRTKCDFYGIKKFEEAYSETVKKRISGILPKDYTRMGPSIRHAAKILRDIEARTMLLVTLSDGKPEDWDAYKGDYGIEDTRKALIEAKEQGIHPFCITIDREAQSYLPHMFGEAGYIFIDDVRKLPNKITEIYRRLTT